MPSPTLRLWRAFGLGRTIRPTTVVHRASLAPTFVSRLKSTLSIIDPSPSASREVPTPLLFLSASKWTSSPTCRDLYSSYIAHFTSEGYQSLLLDLDPDVDLSTVRDSASLLSLFEEEITSTLRSTGGGFPFPAVMIARGVASIIAQTYVSSHPLSALQLIDPPLTNDHLRSQHPGLLPTKLEEFKFHTQFPLRVVWSKEEMERQKQEGTPWYDIHRIEHIREEEADQSLDRFVFQEEQQQVEDTRRWLEDEVGVIGDHPDDLQSSNEQEHANSSDDITLFEGFEDIDLHHPNERCAHSTNDLESQHEEPALSFSSPSFSCIDTPQDLPEWFTSGTYTLQPHSRKYPLTLDERHLSESFVRGGGPGGQAINKLSTNVQLVHIPTSTRVNCQETRSRLRNRELARRRLSRVLENLVRGTTIVGGKSRSERESDRERRKKMNKKKKQAKRRREREREQGDGTEEGEGK